MHIANREPFVISIQCTSRHSPILPAAICQDVDLSYKFELEVLFSGRFSIASGTEVSSINEDLTVINDILSIEPTF